MKAFWEFLSKDPLRKIIALLLSIVLYAVLNEGKQQQKDLINVPVEITCDDGVFISNSSRHAAIRLTVRGSESRIKDLNVQDIVGTIDISRNTPGFDSGTVSIQLSPNNFVCPHGIEIIGIKPEVLTLPVQRRISREVPIRADITGRPRQGYAQGEVSCYPKTVLVTGPEQAVRNLGEVRTETYNIKDYETETVILNLKLMNMNPDEFTFNISTVGVTIPFTRDIQRQLTQVPVRCFMPASRRMQADPEVQVVSVTVSGLQSDLDQITPDDVMVYVDLNDPKFAEAGEFQVNLRAVFSNPERRSRMRVIAIEPGTIRVRCTKADDSE